MTNPYGLKGAPVAARGFGGLPRRKEGTVTVYRNAPSGAVVPVANTTTHPTQVLFLTLSQTYEVPAWATSIRVSVIGRGGAGMVTGTSTTFCHGGGGGGFSGTGILAVVGGALINVSVASNVIQAIGLGFTLTAFSGSDGTANAPGQGGVGYGGTFTYTGGVGGYAPNSAYAGGGGGAAGRGGNGGNGSGPNGGPGAPGIEWWGGSSGGGPGYPTGAPGAVGADSPSFTYVLAGCAGTTIGRGGAYGGGGGGYNVTTNLSAGWNIDGGPSACIIELW